MGQYSKVSDPSFGAVVLTFDYENISNLMTFATRRCSQKFGQFFYELFRERGFAGQRSLRMKNQLYKICSCYVSLECILYWFENTKEPMPENQYLRRIHSIIDSIRKSYFYWGVRCGYSILKRSVKLTRFKSFPLQLSRHQDIPLLSFVRVASSTLLRCG